MGILKIEPCDNRVFTMFNSLRVGETFKLNDYLYLKVSDALQANAVCFGSYDGNELTARMATINTDCKVEDVKFVLRQVV